MTITKVSLLDHLTDEIDICEVELDGADTALITWNYTNLLEYVGGEAVVTFRMDIYKGSPARFINTLAKVGVINTLERESNIKLFTDVTDNHSTVSFRDIAEGTTVQKAVVYIVSVTFDSSARATWCDFTMMDRERKLATLRVFNPSTTDAKFKGRYVLCDIRRNKYGFSTDSLTTIDATYQNSPEVTIAESYIMQAFADDTDVLRVLQESSFISFCKQYVTEEPGYDLVRLAIELDMCNEMANLVQGVDFRLVRHSLLFSHFTVLNSQSVFDKDIVGFATIQRFKFPTRRDVLEILYSSDERLKRERAAMWAVLEMADSAVKLKKGMV